MSKIAVTLQDLIKIKQHKGYFLNTISGKITYRRVHNGQPIKIPTGKTKIGEAKAFVEVELERLKSGSSLRQAKRKKLKITNPDISALYAEMIAEYTPGKSPSTVTNYWQAWNRGLKDFWADKHVSDINVSTIAAFKNHWLETRPTKLSEKAQDHLFQLFRWLVANKHLAEKPDVSKLADLEELIKKGMRWKKVGRVYTDSEQAALLSCWPEFLKGSTDGTSAEHKVVLASRIRLAILLGLRRGLRIGEVCTLERSKIDLKLKKLEVWSQKNSEWRDIPIEADLAEALKYQLEANAEFDSKWVFPSPENPETHISPQVLSKVWHRARACCGIIPTGPRDARFHDLRKTFATMTARHGWAPKAACEMLDMTLAIYEATYANDVGLEVKARLIEQSFGGGK